MEGKTLVDVYPDLLAEGWASAVLTPEVIASHDLETTIAELRRELRRQARADRIRIQTVVSGTDFEPRAVVAVRRNWEPTQDAHRLIWKYTGYHACANPSNDVILVRPDRHWAYCPRCGFEYDWDVWRGEAA